MRIKNIGRINALFSLFCRVKKVIYDSVRSWSIRNLTDSRRFVQFDSLDCRSVTGEHTDGHAGRTSNNSPENVIYHPIPGFLNDLKSTGSLLDPRNTSYQNTPFSSSCGLVYRLSNYRITCYRCSANTWQMGATFIMRLPSHAGSWLLS